MSSVNTLVKIAHYFYDGKSSAEDLALAKKFFEAAEEYGDPEASDYLSCLQKNPLIAEAMWLRVAERNAPCPVSDLQESDEEKANYWRKKIAETEGKPLEEDALTDEEILKSERLRLFGVYSEPLRATLTQ